MLPTILVLLFPLLAIIGAADTSYLISKRKKAEVPICPLRGDCTFVLKSKYNKIFGLYADVIGLAYFLGILLWLVTIIGLMILLSFGIDLFPRDQGTGMLTATGSTMAYVFYLTPIVATLLAFIMSLRMDFIQFFILKKYCFWCLVSSACVVGMTAIVIAMIYYGSGM